MQPNKVSIKFPKRTDLKAYIEQIKSQFNQQNQRQQLEFLKQAKSYFRPKKYKKVVVEEESEDDTSLETEEIEEEPQVKKPKRKNKSSLNVFE